MACPPVRCEPICKEEKEMTFTKYADSRVRFYPPEKTPSTSSRSRSCSKLCKSIDTLLNSLDIEECTLECNVKPCRHKSLMCCKCKSSGEANEYVTVMSKSLTTYNVPKAKAIDKAIIRSKLLLDKHKMSSQCLSSTFVNSQITDAQSGLTVHYDISTYPSIKQDGRTFKSSFSTKYDVTLQSQPKDKPICGTMDLKKCYDICKHSCAKRSLNENLSNYKDKDNFSSEIVGLSECCNDICTCSYREKNVQPKTDLAKCYNYCVHPCAKQNVHSGIETQCKGIGDRKCYDSCKFDCAKRNLTENIIKNENVDNLTCKKTGLAKCYDICSHPCSERKYIGESSLSETKSKTICKALKGSKCYDVCKNDCAKSSFNEKDDIESKYNKWMYGDKAIWRPTNSACRLNTNSKCSGGCLKTNKYDDDSLSTYQVQNTNTISTGGCFNSCTKQCSEKFDSPNLSKSKVSLNLDFTCRSKEKCIDKCTKKCAKFEKTSTPTCSALPTIKKCYSSCKNDCSKRITTEKSQSKPHIPPAKKLGKLEYGLCCCKLKNVIKEYLNETDSSKDFPNEKCKLFKCKYKNALEERPVESYEIESFVNDLPSRLDTDWQKKKSTTNLNHTPGYEERVYLKPDDKKDPYESSLAINFSDIAKDNNLISSKSVSFHKHLSTCNDDIGNNNLEVEKLIDNTKATFDCGPRDQKNKNRSAPKGSTNRKPFIRKRLKPRKPEKLHPMHENSTLALYRYKLRGKSVYSKLSFSPFKIYKLGERGSGIRPRGEVQDFYSLRDYHLRNGTLFEDPEFRAENSSLFYSQRPDRHFEWKRPGEIVDNPQLFVEGYSRFDVQQGELGDCWLLAAVANLTLYRRLFFQIVPDDQGFDDKYAGIFHFRFWQYGRWIDVVIDDRLPTYRGQLVFLHSTEENEFWSALLEKAYAKLHGSYEALKGGSTCEAMEDFTGGVTEMYEMEATPPNLFKIILKAYERSSLMGCSIEPDPHVLEAETPQGLIRGHAYSITRVKYVDIQTPNSVGKIPLLRLRNPWGNETEWNGPWSDKSPEWRFIPEHEKDELGLTFDDDGEFWMSFKDFQTHFSRLEICNLNPDSLTEEEIREGNKKQWEMSVFEGEFVRGVTAGGCRNYLDTFWHNPQYRVTLTEPDEGDDEGKCTVIVALMQKNRRSQRNMGADVFLTIGFAIYHLPYPDRVPKPLDLNFFKYNASVARSPSFINLREVSCRFKLPPGTYCIVPSTFEPNEEGEFLLRVFSENKNNMEENDEPVGYGEIDTRVKETEPSPEEHKETDKVREFFLKLAGDDMEVDWKELKDIMDYALRNETPLNKTNVNGLDVAPGEGQGSGDNLLTTLLGLICGTICKDTPLADIVPVSATEATTEMAPYENKNKGFSKDICRSMVAMLDADKSGKLGFEEFKTLWMDIRNWKMVFKLYDKDNSGTLSGYELRQALNSAGYRLNNHILNILMHRYGNKNGEIEFDDFIMCAVKLKTMMDVFQDKDQDKTNSATFSLEEWLERTLYS